MSLLLTWALNNKLASLLGVALIAMTIFCTFQYFEIKLLGARLTVAEENLKARTAALKALEAEAEALRGRIAAGEARIRSERRTYEKKLKEIQDAHIPEKCEEAVKWGSGEINTLIGGY